MSVALPFSEEILRADLRHYNALSNLQFNNKIKALIEKGNVVHHFGFGQSPFPVPNCLVNALKENAHRSEYLPVEGLASLREEILSFHRRNDGMEQFTSDSVVFGCGLAQMLYLNMAVFGGEVVLVTPAWTAYTPQAHFAGRPVRLVHTTRERNYLPTAQQIETALRAPTDDDKRASTKTKMLILNSPNNPSGAVLKPDQLAEIAQVCKKYNAIVVSDEVYARLTFDGKFTSISKFYPQGTVVVSGFSKWASAGGWRAGYALFPVELQSLKRAVAQAGINSFTCGSAPIQHALAAGLKCTDELDDYLHHCRKILAACAHHVQRKLEGFGVPSSRSEAAYYSMLDLSQFEGSFADATDICDQILRQSNVAVMPCAPYFARPDGELSARLCFVNFDGAKALAASRQLPRDAAISEGHDEESGFVVEYCAPLVKGIDCLGKWLQSNRVAGSP